MRGNMDGVKRLLDDFESSMPCANLLRRLCCAEGWRGRRLIEFRHQGPNPLPRECAARSGVQVARVALTN